MMMIIIIIKILIQQLLLLIIIWYHSMIPHKRCGGQLLLSLGLHIQCVDPSGKLPTIALPQTKKLCGKNSTEICFIHQLKKIDFSCEAAYEVSSLFLSWV